MTKTKSGKTYAAACQREGNWWVIAVYELDRVTQARRLDQAEAMARDLIALWLDVDPSSFAVIVDMLPSR
jgi:predicted RNase H-like HicB family nuclease